MLVLMESLPRTGYMGYRGRGIRGRRSSPETPGVSHRSLPSRPRWEASMLVLQPPWPMLNRFPPPPRFSCSSPPDNRPPFASSRLTFVDFNRTAGWMMHGFTVLVLTTDERRWEMMNSAADINYHPEMYHRANPNC